MRYTPQECVPGALTPGTRQPRMIGPTVIASTVTERPVSLRLLGPTHLPGFAPGALPGRAVELLTYLHLHPGSSGVQVQHALWPDRFDTASGHVRTLAKRTRSALGHDHDGRPWLPEATKAGYRLHPALTSDWSNFQRLIGPNPAQTPTSALCAAVRLVGGQPLDGITRRAGWWTWRGPIEETMIDAVLTAAAELFRRSMDIGRLSDARTAATIARSTDPLNETGWRMELTLAMRRGDPDAYTRVVAELRAALGPIPTLDPATRHLLAHAPAALRKPRRP